MGAAERGGALGHPRGDALSKQRARPEAAQGVQVTALQRLDLEDTKVTDAGVGQLRKSLPNVEVTR